jgi:hypothetical protein
MRPTPPSRVVTPPLPRVRGRTGEVAVEKALKLHGSAEQGLLGGDHHRRITASSSRSAKPEQKRPRTSVSAVSVAASGFTSAGTILSDGGFQAADALLVSQGRAAALHGKRSLPSWQQTEIGPIGESARAAASLEGLDDMGLEDLRLPRELEARFFHPWP